jgi:thiamine biosynthesis lipoprotein
MKSLTFEAIGTAWSIDFYTEISSEKLEILEKKIFDRIEIFDKTYSRFRPDSIVSKIAREKGTYVLPKDAAPLLDLYKQLYSITDGAVTPLIGNVLSQAGYDANYSMQAHTLHKPKRWEEIISFDSPKLTIKEPTILDFGAAGKGYLVDIIGALLEEHGIDSYCVDASGDMLFKHRENKKLKVGLEHPEDPTQAIGIVDLSKGSICGSAGNRRKWGDFNHIINPHTLESSKEIRAVWVIAPTTMLADALTTCLFFVPVQTIQKHFSFEYVIIKDDYTYEVSKDFPGELFIKKH